MGVWWGREDARNFSAPLAGRLHTNQRAELAAVTFALEHETGNVHIKSDSAYVVNCCSRHRFAWKALRWHKIGNADLWKHFDSSLEARLPGSARIKSRGMLPKTM